MTICLRHIQCLQSTSVTSSCHQPQIHVVHGKQVPRLEHAFAVEILTSRRGRDRKGMRKKHGQKCKRATQTGVVARAGDGGRRQKEGITGFLYFFPITLKRHLMLQSDSASNRRLFLGNDILLLSPAPRYCFSLGACLLTSHFKAIQQKHTMRYNIRRRFCRMWCLLYHKTRFPHAQLRYPHDLHLTSP